MANNNKTIKLTIEVCVNRLSIAYTDKYGTTIGCTRPKSLTQYGFETVCETPEEIKKIIEDSNATN